MEINNDDEVLGWHRTTGTFAGQKKTFWVNKNTGKSVWVLPPPGVLVPTSTPPSTPVRTPGTIERYIHKLSDPMAPINDDTYRTLSTCSEAKTALELMFLPEKVQYLDDRNGEGTGLWSRCEAFGIKTRAGPQEKRIGRKELERSVYEYFRELHKKEGTIPTASECYKPDLQVIARERAEHINHKKRKLRLARLVDAGAKKRNMTKRNHKKSLTKEEAVLLWSNRGYHIDPADGHLRCMCSYKNIKDKDATHHKIHFTSAVHQRYEARRKVTQQQQGLLAAAAVAENQEQKQLSVVLAGARVSALDQDPRAQAFRQRTLRAFLGVGISPAKIDKLRRFLEGEVQLPLIGAQALKHQFLKSILKVEEEQLLHELRGKIVSLIFDATPRMGDVFALLARFVSVKEGRAKVEQRLIHVAFCKKSMDNTHVQSEVTRGMLKAGIRGPDVVSWSVDACSVNILAHKNMQMANDIVIFLCLCISHCANNAGNQCSYVVLTRFWHLLQTCFKNSDRAQQIWEQITTKTWQTYSETRWYSMLEVLEWIYEKLISGAMKMVITQLVKEKISKLSAAKLLVMLTDPATMWLVKIQMSAMVEGLRQLRNLCYGLEGDNVLIIKGGLRLRRLKIYCPLGCIPPLPKTDKLIEDAVAWVVTTDEGKALQEAQDVRTEAQTAPRTIAQIHAAAGARPMAARRPRRAAAGGVAVAVDAGQSAAAQAAQQQARQAREAARAAQEAHEEADRAARQAELDAAYDKGIEDAVAEEARLQALALPLTADEWKTGRGGIHAPVKKAWQYFWERCEAGGDRHNMIKLMLAASICMPSYAKTVQMAEAMTMIEGLRILSELNDDMLIQSLKDGWPAYHYYASRTIKKDIDLVQWWYDHREVRDTDVPKPAARCKMCGLHVSLSSSEYCNCNAGLEAWWAVVQKLVLVQPSSASAERVFSILKAFWNHLQTRTLSDTVLVSLFLAVNGRGL